MIEAELADGTILEFPDGTPGAVIDRAVKQQLGLENPAPAMGVQSAQAAPVQEPEAPGPSGPARVLMGMGREIQAGLQGTSPITETVTGRTLREPLGEMIESDAGPGFMGPDGFTLVSPGKHVILTDPTTGKTAVFPRTPESDERIGAAGRLLSFGALAPATVPVRGAQAATKSQQLLSDFEKSGVDPTIPSVTQSRSAGVATQGLRNVPGAGGVIQRETRAQVGQAAEAVERAAKERGTVRSADDVGTAIQKGVERFDDAPRVAASPEEVIRLPTRATSISQKAGALYDRVAAKIPAQEKFDAAEFSASLTAAGKRFDDPGVGSIFNDPELARWKSVLDKSGGVLSWNDMRQFRSEVGKLLRKPVLHTDIDRAQLNGAYKALTRDLEKAALEAGGDAALAAFKRADAFYAKALDRLENGLKKFFDAKTPEMAYERALKAAQQKGGDVRGLIALKRSVGDDVWGDFVATVIDRMGRATPGATDALSAENFSPATFLTEYSKLSEKAKGVLFGGPGLAEVRKSWDALVRTVGALKNVERLANTSNTGGTVVSAAIGAGLATEPVTTVLAVAGARGLGGVMMSPRFTRWLLAAEKIKSPELMAGHIARLRAIATADQRFGQDILALHNALAEDRSRDQNK